MIPLSQYFKNQQENWSAESLFNKPSVSKLEEAHVPTNSFMDCLRISLLMLSEFNPFVPNAPVPYHLKTSENRKVSWSNVFKG